MLSKDTLRAKRDTLLRQRQHLADMTARNQGAIDLVEDILKRLGQPVDTRTYVGAGPITFGPSGFTVPIRPVAVEPSESPDAPWLQHSDPGDEQPNPLDYNILRVNRMRKDAHDFYYGGNVELSESPDAPWVA